jgi:iron-sulfur cluster repair protein YtfE (RIC family)
MEVNIARAKETTLAELPAASLCAVRIFEKLRIDYCSGG